MSTNQPRTPAGTPAGGQWAPMAHAEAEVELEPLRTTVPPKQPWVASDDLGPVQAKRALSALRALRSEGKTFVELTGVLGSASREWVMTDVFGQVRPEVDLVERELGARFGWQITRANYKQLVEAAAQATEEVKASRPVVDKRITPEQDRERQVATIERDRAQREQALREDALMAQVRQRAPVGAGAVVVAELQEDTSDVMSDYHANKTLRRVAIGYRFGQREDFRQLRAVAATFPETAHLTDESSERRDNWSMGAGNYLTDHNSANWGSGWIVRSYPLDTNPRLTEVAIPGGPDQSVPA